MLEIAGNDEVSSGLFEVRFLDANLVARLDREAISDDGEDFPRPGQFLEPSGRQLAAAGIVEEGLTGRVDLEFLVDVGCRVGLQAQRFLEVVAGQCNRTWADGDSSLYGKHRRFAAVHLRRSTQWQWPLQALGGGCTGVVEHDLLFVA